MEILKLNEFLDRADDFIKNAALGEEFYSIETKAGNAIIISEDEWKMLTDAMGLQWGVNQNIVIKIYKAKEFALAFCLSYPEKRDNNLRIFCLFFA